MATIQAYKYETVAASQTGQVLGTTGATGDRIKTLVVTVGTAATSTVAIIDGSTSYSIMAAVTPIGVYTISFGEGLIATTGAWSVTTGAGATVLAIGSFT